jgi:uncharacterized membrane protein
LPKRLPNVGSPTPFPSFSDCDRVTPSTFATPRAQSLDLARGVAILAMVVFHVAWDLYYFGWSAVDVTTEPGWVAFQKSILSSFLLLAGASLWLGHGAAIRWRPFWRRFALVLAAALATTAGTYWMFPDYFVFFGVLHAIAAFSLLALPLLRVPPLLLAGLGSGIIAAPLLWSHPAFTDRALAWIGFWPVSPPTSDVVPVFPWFGVVLLGVAGMRLLAASPLWPRLAAWRSEEPLLRGLAWLGRWSLPVYLLHQPLLICAMTLLLQLQPAVLAPDVELPQDAAFLRSCTQSCSASGTAANCTTYCSCALEQVADADLWDAVGKPQSAAAEQDAIAAIGRLCTAMALP